ncbi:MAG: VCBS repeat-containing protein, partial [bacterium]|nr:VCBS repeat-containing protein [bacterium]
MVAEGKVGILLVLCFTALFSAESSFTQFNRVWTESRVEDFADGQLDPMMYVSRRTVAEPDSGCIEFFSRFDLDNNGYFDLVSSDDSGPYLRVYFGSASGYSVANSRYYPVPGGGNVDLADLNLDGYAELIHSGWRSGHITIYWGTDSGPSPVDTTWLVISGQSEAVTVYDLDRDAYLDIIAGSDNGMVYIFWGDANGYNSSRRSSIFLNGSVGHNLEVADFDKDGFGDIVASLWSRNQAPVIYWGSGRSPQRIVWLPVSGNNPHGVTVADLNDDSWLDLVFTGYDTVTSAFIYYGSASGFSVSNREIIHPGQCYGGSAAVLWNYDKTLDLVFYRGDWGKNVAYRPRVYFNRPDTTPHFSDARFSEIGELEFNASGGLIADLNYDGFQDIFINNMMPDSASFVLWGPYYNSATPLPVDRDHHGLWREVGNIYTRGFYARYLSSIYYIGEDSVIAGGSCSWVANEPLGSSVGIEVRAGNTPVPDETWTEFTPILINGGSLPQTVNGFKYLQYRAFFSYSRPCYLPYLERVSFNITLRPPIDAAVRAILAPVGIVDSGSVIVPRVVIENLHSGTPVATVTLKVGDDYLSTQIDTLGPFALDTVSFAVWAAQVLGVHIVRCSVYVAGDENRANDTLSTTVEVVAGSDVGPVAIVLPPVRAESGSVHVPAVVVRNFGVRQEIFPVHLFIGGDYHEVVIDTLVPGGSDTVRFPAWVAHPVGPVVVRCSTGLERDNRRENDTLSRLVDVWAGIDAAVLAVIAPQGIVDSGVMVVPRAFVANHSTGAQQIPVRLWIDGGYSDIRTVLVAPDDTVLVSFTSWVAS